MIIDEEEIELAVQFQREADGLIKDLLKAFMAKQPYLDASTLCDVPYYIKYLLCERLEAAVKAEYRNDGLFDPSLPSGVPGTTGNVIGDRSVDQLIDDIFADAGRRIEQWRSEKEREQSEYDAEDARATFRVVGKEEDES
jgi:hypothetical protein